MSKSAKEKIKDKVAKAAESEKPAPEVEPAESSSVEADYEKHPKFDKFKPQGEN